LRLNSIFHKVQTGTHIKDNFIHKEKKKTQDSFHLLKLIMDNHNKIKIKCA